MKTFRIILILTTSLFTFCLGSEEENKGEEDQRKVIRSMSGEGFGRLVRQKQIIHKVVNSAEKGDFVFYTISYQDKIAIIVFKTKEVEKKLETFLEGKNKIEVECLFYESLQINSGEPELGAGTTENDRNYIKKGTSWNYSILVNLYDIEK